MLLVGTTKNNIIQGTIDLRFSLIIQVNKENLLLFCHCESLLEPMKYILDVITILEENTGKEFAKKCLILMKHDVRYFKLFSEGSKG